MNPRTPGNPSAAGPGDPWANPVHRIDLDQPAPAEVNPTALVRLVLSCPGVVAMHGGIAGEVATYLPGQRIVGVRIQPDAVQVQVVSRWPISARDLAGQIWAATAPAVGGRRVDVVIGDVQLPETGAGR